MYNFMKSVVLFFIFIGITLAQQSIPQYYQVDQEFSEKLHQIIQELDLDKDFDVGEDGIEQISFAVIDLNSALPKFGGVNYDNFIYPASVYKMYVAAEILNQVSQGKLSLYQDYVIKSPNDVDKVKEIPNDPRPLLADGDTVTINYLLDLMITRSDNSAANCLIDLADRKNINRLIKDNGWIGSEVTRKFLPRKFEDEEYKKVRGTETSALHAADFMYKVYKNQLCNYWVSSQLKTLLGRQLDKTKLPQGFPQNSMFYHKTGWFSYWTNDVGIYDDGETKFIIACFLPIPENEALPKFKLIAEEVYKLIKGRN
ncbi:MAG: hypothetical protein CMF23_01640 [Ignavibacteriae bacterium]|nr:hypothetical protein [Ignavibacteriota bacterium]